MGKIEAIKGLVAEIKAQGATAPATAAQYAKLDLSMSAKDLGLMCGGVGRGLALIQSHMEAKPFVEKAVVVEPEWEEAIEDWKQDMRDGDDDPEDFEDAE
jgi:hypothetical protein